MIAITNSVWYVAHVDEISFFHTTTRVMRVSQSSLAETEVRGGVAWYSVHCGPTLLCANVSTDAGQQESYQSG